MRDRLESILKIACVALVAFLVYRLVGVAIHGNPLARVSIPALPRLSPDTNAPAAGKGTNVVPPGALAKAGTNAPSQRRAPPGTNAVARPDSTKGPAPTVAIESPLVSGSTNKSSASVVSNGAVLAHIGTNAVLLSGGTTQGTTVVSRTVPEKSGTNATTAQRNVKGDTNASARVVASANARPEMAAMAMGGSQPGGPGGRGGIADLPPAVKARVYRVYDSEIFGPIMRPLPMALLGIAGDTAFLRAPNGQTGLVKTNDELGGLKLLKIGVNRVLVEQDGEKKELIIFNGYGGESLLPK